LRPRHSLSGLNLTAVRFAHLQFLFQRGNCWPLPCRLSRLTGVQVCRLYR